MNDPVLSTVRSWIRTHTPPDTKSPEIQQSKGILRYCQEFDRLPVEEEGQVFCYNEPSDKSEEKHLRIRLLFFLFVACFRLDIMTKWLETWEQLKLMPMPRDSTIGPECLIGYVL